MFVKITAGVITSLGYHLGPFWEIVDGGMGVIMQMTHSWTHFWISTLRTNKIHWKLLVVCLKANLGAHLEACLANSYKDLIYQTNQQQFDLKSVIRSPSGTRILSFFFLFLFFPRNTHSYLVSLGSFLTCIFSCPCTISSPSIDFGISEWSFR